MSLGVGPAGGPDHVVSEMNTTPLIDVMLVLLVMLILTIPIQTHAVKIDMPIGPSSGAPPAVVNLEIDFDGTAIWNGTPLKSTAELDRYLQDSAAAMPQPEVHVKPNRLAKYEAVAKTLAHAQRLGLTKVGFVGNEQYTE